MIVNTEVIYKDASPDGNLRGYFESNTSKVAAQKRDQVLAGGAYNTISGDYSFLGGGFLNTNSGTYSVIVGGYCNNAFGDFASVVGGLGNVSCSNYSFVGGGFKNCSLAANGYIGGGYCSVILPGHEGAAILADSVDKPHVSSGPNTLTIDFANGIYFNGQIWHEGQNVTSNIKDLGGVIRPRVRFIPETISGMFV